MTSSILFFLVCGLTGTKATIVQGDKLGSGPPRFANTYLLLIFVSCTPSVLMRDTGGSSGVTIPSSVNAKEAGIGTIRTFAGMYRLLLGSNRSTSSSTKESTTLSCNQLAMMSKAGSFSSPNADDDSHNELVDVVQEVCVLTFL